MTGNSDKTLGNGRAEEPKTTSVIKGRLSLAVWLCKLSDPDRSLAFPLARKFLYCF